MNNQARLRQYIELTVNRITEDFEVLQKYALSLGSEIKLLKNQVKDLQESNK